MDFGIIDIVVSTMEDVETFQNSTGKQKREHALRRIKHTVGPETYEKYEDFLPILIDFIIAISKKEYLLNLNEIKNCYKKCFSCINLEL